MPSFNIPSNALGLASGPGATSFNSTVSNLTSSFYQPDTKLLDSVLGKVVGSTMVQNPSLAKITDTTFIGAGTSISQIGQTAFNDAKSAVTGQAGIQGASSAVMGQLSGLAGSTISKFGLPSFSISDLLSPLSSMLGHCNSINPANAPSFKSAYDRTLNKVNDSFMSSLPGIDNSLFDIQSSCSTALNNGIGHYADLISGINPSLVDSSIGVGKNLMSGVNQNINSITTIGYNASIGSLKNSVSNIFSTVGTDAVNRAASLVDDTDGIEFLTDEEATSIQVNKSTTIEISHEESGLTTVSEDIDGTKTHPDTNSTDNIYQDIKVYVEGVQVPFEACSITQSIGQFPSARFQLPPQAGLMDICRYYQPKVHIFYTDANTGGDRLLFMGHIVACNYAHSQQAASVSISFECLHKNALLGQLTFEWSAGGAAHSFQETNLTNSNPDSATVQLNNVNSKASLMLSLQGLDGVQSEAADLIDPSNSNISNNSIHKLDKKFKEFEKRLIGMPGSMMNVWNQVKKTIFANPALNVIFTKVYLPLVEEGIQFFNRTSGHYYLENMIQESKVDPCNDSARPELANKIMLPPAFRLNILSAVQSNMAVENLNAMLGFSGELMNFHDLFMNFYYGVEYEMLTLASPAEVPVDPTTDINPDDTDTWTAESRMAVETIIKPQIPFYYSPICNVILPNMFHSISVTQLESDIPSRITAVSMAAAQATNNPSLLGQNYRAPQSIRESVALGRTILDIGNKNRTPATLRNTTGSSFNIPGKYELGRGISHTKITMPNWLTQYVADKNNGKAAGSDYQVPAPGSLDAKSLSDLEAAWSSRYGYKTGEDGNTTRDTSKDVLNPYRKESDILAYERLLFSAADYSYTKSVVKAKTGNLEGLFNPYIIPGYPMDIINKSPNHPSFHAMCASVTHNFTSRSISTSVGFMAAITYTEMYNYFISPIHPWLQTALNMVNVKRTGVFNSKKSIKSLLDDGTLTKGPSLMDDSDDAQFEGAVPLDSEDSTSDVDSVSQTIINNPNAKATADKFYKSVLGVGAVGPEQIYNFETAEVLPVARNNGIWVPGITGHTPTPNGGEGNQNLTGVGNLRLVSRQIEGKRGIEDRFGVKFIDMTPTNYSGTPASYTNAKITESQLLEPGASLFLDYEEVTDFIDDVIDTLKNKVTQ